MQVSCFSQHAALFPCTLTLGHPSYLTTAYTTFVPFYWQTWLSWHLLWKHFTSKDNYNKTFPLNWKILKKFKIFWTCLLLFIWNLFDFLYILCFIYTKWKLFFTIMGWIFWIFLVYRVYKKGFHELPELQPSGGSTPTAEVIGSNTHWLSWIQPTIFQAGYKQ